MPDLPSLAETPPGPVPRLRPAPLRPGPFTALERRSVILASVALGLAAHAAWSGFAAAARLAAFGDAAAVWSALAAAAAPLAAMAAGPLVESLAARLRFRIAVPAALVLAAAGALGAATANSAQALVAWRLLMGLGAVELAASAWLPAWVDEARFARGAAALAMAKGAGAVTGLATALLVSPVLAMWLAAVALLFAAAFSALGPKPAAHCKQEFHPQPQDRAALTKDPALRRIYADENVRGAAIGAAVCALPWVLLEPMRWPPFVAAFGLLWAASRARTLEASSLARRLALLAACAGALGLGLARLWPPLALLGAAAVIAGAWMGESGASAEVTWRAAEMRLGTALALRSRAVWLGALYGAVVWGTLSVVLTREAIPNPASWPLTMVALAALGSTLVSSLRKLPSGAP